MDCELRRAAWLEQGGRCAFPDCQRRCVELHHIVWWSVGGRTSLGVVRKGIAMFEKVNVPILGIIENMSYFMTPNGERVEIFGHGGGHARHHQR